MRRLVIVLADGLRPDAVTPTVMPSLDIVTAELRPAALPVAWTVASTAGVRRLFAA